MELLGGMVMPRIDRLDPKASVLWVVLRVFAVRDASRSRPSDFYRQTDIEAARKATCKVGLLAVSTVYENDDDPRILCRVECNLARVLVLERQFLAGGSVDLDKLVLEVLACKVEH